MSAPELCGYLVATFVGPRHLGSPLGGRTGATLSDGVTHEVLCTRPATQRVDGQPRCDYDAGRRDWVREQVAARSTA